MAMKISFHGAAREVTGSNHLLDTGSARIVVDCGLHQGHHFCEGRNARPFPYDPASIDAVVVTHAHVDHTGLLPKLVRDGFRGKIFATEPTKQFAELLLHDSAGLIAEEARERREKPLYLPEDVGPAMERFVAVSYHKPTEIAPGVQLTLYDAGHVIGSSFALIEAAGKRVIFSGDLGNSPTLLLRDLEAAPAADYIVIESTYGDRVHENRERRRDLLRTVVEETLRRKGVLLIPSFAFERAQEIVAELNSFLEHQRLPGVQVFLDSPLAVKATALYQRFPEYYNDREREAIVGGDVPFRFPGMSYAETVEQSKAINAVPPPKVIISSSGMLQGGRILHHALRYLQDPNSTLLIIGYQAAGSLGRRLLDHAQAVTILNTEIPVRAQMKAIGAYSSHADQDALLGWLGAVRPKPAKVFVVHGEESSALALQQLCRDRLNIDATVPLPDETIIL